VDDFYTQFLQELPRDEWGHPVLPMPEKISREQYAQRLLELQIELVKMQTWARNHGERVLLLFEGRDTALGALHARRPRHVPAVRPA
jgi:polyphosphate kinase 2 (PPK2 family)